MKYIIFLLPILVLGQVQSIDYTNNLPKTTTPLTIGDKNKIKDVVNNNATILGQLDAQIDLLKGGAIRTISKAVPPNSGVNFFSMASANGVISLTIQIASDNIGFQVSKNITLNYAKGNASFMAQSTGGFNGHDFDITYTPIDDGLGNILGFTFQVNNLSTTETAQITLTMIVGGLTNGLTYAQL